MIRKMIYWLKEESKILEHYESYLENTIKNISEDGPVMNLHSLTHWYEMGLRYPGSKEKQPFPMKIMMEELLQNIPYRVRELDEETTQYVVQDVAVKLCPEEWKVRISPIREFPLDSDAPVQNKHLSIAYDCLRSYELGEISLVEGAKALRDHLDTMNGHTLTGIQKKIKHLYYAWFLRSPKKRAAFSAMCEKDKNAFLTVKAEFEEKKKSQLEDLFNLIHQMNKSGLMTLLREIESETDYDVVFENLCNGVDYIGTDGFRCFCENLLQEKDQLK